MLKPGPVDSGASSADAADEERELRTCCGRILTLLNRLIGLTGLRFGARDLRRHALARHRAEAGREAVIRDLEQALAEVKALSGLIPICASCKKIRDDRGYWTQIETCVQQQSNATFSHGLCLDCLRKLAPEVAGAVEARLTNPAPAPPPPDRP